MNENIFDGLQLFKGWVEPGFVVNFLGVRTRSEMWDVLQYDVPSEPRQVETQYPPFDPQWFEWHDMVEAARNATDQFTMIELGAGWGRWLVNAAAVVKQTSKVPLKLIGVEAEPTHFRWMKQHFLDNDLSPDDHSLIEAAVSAKAGDAWFFIGEPSRWYGQRMTKEDARLPKKYAECESVKKIKVRTITLASLLESQQQIDLIDLDIQGAELEVLSATVDQLQEKVCRVHIETHSSYIEQGLRELFSSMRWEKKMDYHCLSKNATPWGIFDFQDGVQSWINPSRCS